MFVVIDLLDNNRVIATGDDFAEFAGFAEMDRFEVKEVMTVKVECLVFLMGKVAHVFLDDVRPEEEIWESKKNMKELRIPDCETWFGDETDRLKYICSCGMQCSSGMSWEAVTHRLSDLPNSEFAGRRPDFEFAR